MGGAALLTDWPVLTEDRFLNLFGAVYELAVLDANLPPEPRNDAKAKAISRQAEYKKRRLRIAQRYAREDARRFLAEIDLRAIFPRHRLGQPLAAARATVFYGGTQAIPEEWPIEEDVHVSPKTPAAE